MRNVCLGVHSGTPGRSTPGTVTSGKNTPGRSTPGRSTPGKGTPDMNFAVTPQAWPDTNSNASYKGEAPPPSYPHPQLSNLPEVIGITTSDSSDLNNLHSDLNAEAPKFRPTTKLPAELGDPPPHISLQPPPMLIEPKLPFGMLRVTIVKGLNLKAGQGVFGKADPYVKIKIGDTQKSTEIHSNSGKNPVSVKYFVDGAKQAIIFKNSVDSSLQSSFLL